jgi:hypothetical protein
MLLVPHQNHGNMLNKLMEVLEITTVVGVHLARITVGMVGVVVEGSHNQGVIRRIKAINFHPVSRRVILIKSSAHSVIAGQTIRLIMRSLTP